MAKNLITASFSKGVLPSGPLSFHLYLAPDEHMYFKAKADPVTHSTVPTIPEALMLLLELCRRAVLASQGLSIENTSANIKLFIGTFSFNGYFIAIFYSEGQAMKNTNLSQEKSGILLLWEIIALKAGSLDREAC